MFVVPISTALTGCDACKRVETRAADAAAIPSTSSPQPPPQQACTGSGPIQTGLVGAEWGEPRLEGGRLLVPTLVHTQEAGYLNVVLSIDAAGTVQRALEGAAEDVVGPGEWVRGTAKPVLLQAIRVGKNRALRLTDVARKTAETVAIPRDTLSYRVVETSKGKLVIRTGVSNIEVADAQTGVVRSTLAAVRPDQVEAQRIGDRVVIAWTSSAPIDLDAGDALEGPGEVRVEQTIETASVDLEGRGATPFTRVLPRDRHIAFFDLLADGTVIAVEEEQQREGDGAAVLRSHIARPTERTVLAMGAGPRVDSLPLEHGLRVVYWSVHEEAFLTPHLPDAGAERVGVLDRGRTLGVFPDGRVLMVRQADGPKAEGVLEFLRCR